MSTADDLLDAVDAVIAEHGASGVTLRRVGSHAGLSHTAAAHYFRDKPGLFTAYIARGWNRIADRLEDCNREPDARAALMAAGRAYAQFALDEPSVFKVIGRIELTNVDAPELWQARERGFFALAGIVERYQLTGWAQHRHVLDLEATMWAFVHGFVELWTGGPMWAPFDGRELLDVLDDLLGQLIDHLGTAPS